MLNTQNAEFLSLEELKTIAPSIFTEKSADSTSSKYTHIPTSQVIKDMELLGWGVTDAKEVKARKTSTVGFQKHLVIFRNNEVVINGEDGDTVYPQVLLTNSHDGKNSFKFQAGLFRMICSNGLVIATTEFNSMKIRHMGYEFGELQTTIKELVAKLPLTIESLNKMKNTELNEEQVLNLAKSLIEIRLEGTNNELSELTIDEILKAQRLEDEGLGLWETFNRIQENIIEGNFLYKTNKNKVRRARPIKNFKQDMDINAKMFEKALEFAS